MNLSDKRKLLSIVVPVYQNEANLPTTIEKLISVGKQLTSLDFEIIFVEDGSQDQSRKILKDAQAKHPQHIRLVLLSRNFGQTPATQAGLHQAKGDCVGIISCDLQEPPELFLEMVKLWESGKKFIIGYRSEREEGLLHRMVSRIYWGLVKKYAFPKFPIDGYDFCLLDRQLVQEINKINEKNSSIFVLIYWLGYDPHLLPIKREIRTQGKSQWSFFKKISFTLDTLYGFTYLPARFISFLGVLFGGLSLLYLVFGLIRWYLLQTAPPGWMTLVALISIPTAVILFSLGAVSEYLMRILDESRKRPLYLVDEVISSDRNSKSG